MIRKLSKKRASQMRIYSKVRKEYLKDHPYCEARIPGCTIQAVDIHHKNKRFGERLIDVKYFMAICRSCHGYLHDSMPAEEAREKGLIV